MTHKGRNQYSNLALPGFKALKLPITPLRAQMSKMMSLFFRYCWVRSQTNHSLVLPAMSLRVNASAYQEVTGRDNERFTRELSYVKNNNKVFLPNPVKLP